MPKSPFVNVIVAERNIGGFIQSVSLDQCIDKEDELRLRIKEDFILQVADDPDIIPEAELELQFGFIGGLSSPRMRFILVDAEVLYADKITMTLKAQDAGYSMKRVERTKVWRGKKSSEIAEEIAAEYGLDVVIDPSVGNYLDGEIPQTSQNDLEFLRDLAAKEGDFVRCFISNGTLFYVREDFEIKSPSLTYSYGSDDRVISFKPSWNTSKAEGKGREIKSIKVQDGTKKVIDKVIDEKVETLSNAKWLFKSEDARKPPAERSEAQRIVEGNPAPSTADGRSETGATNTEAEYEGNPKQESMTHINQPQPDEQANENELNSIRNEENKKIFSATLKVSMNPRLELDDLVTMKGALARRHQGNWHIKKLTHSIGTGGATTVIGLDRDSQPNINGDGSTPSKGNAQEGDAEKTTAKPIVAYRGNSEKRDGLERLELTQEENDRLFPN